MSVLEFIIPNMLYPTPDPRYKWLDEPEWDNNVYKILSFFDFSPNLVETG